MSEPSFGNATSALAVTLPDFLRQTLEDRARVASNAKLETGEERDVAPTLGGVARRGGS